MNKTPNMEFHQLMRKELGVTLKTAWRMAIKSEFVFAKQESSNLLLRV
ncbi:hypothetical protein [Spiroplasma endosymbiont of Lariophagus distinguendus]|nr:hypothetical protein [Spiroplasma endosymbiont of Lariophagus distinguendus]